MIVVYEYLLQIDMSKKSNLDIPRFGSIIYGSRVVAWWRMYYATVKLVTHKLHIITDIRVKL